jgi:hypothetical protein
MVDTRMRPLSYLGIGSLVASNYGSARFLRRTRRRLVAPFCREADLAARGFRKLSESADFRQQLLNRRIVRRRLAALPLHPPRQLVDPLRQLGVQREHRQRAHERPHDQHTHLCGRSQQVRGHETAVLRERQRQAVGPSAALQRSRKLRQHALPLHRRHFRCEVRWKAIDVTANLLVETPSRNSVERRKVRVQHHPLSADQMNRADSIFNCGHIPHLDESDRTTVASSAA